MQGFSILSRHRQHLMAIMMVQEGCGPESRRMLMLQASWLLRLWGWLMTTAVCPVPSAHGCARLTSRRPEKLSDAAACMGAGRVESTPAGLSSCSGSLIMGRMAAHARTLSGILPAVTCSAVHREH